MLRNCAEENNPAQTSRKMKTALFLRKLRANMWSGAHLAQTLLHLLQVTLSYLLMLVFMTYNTWLCAALVAGLTAGYFLFGWRKQAAVLRPADLVDGDCCH